MEAKAVGGGAWRKNNFSARQIQSGFVPLDQRWLAEKPSQLKWRVIIVTGVH
jgi:hypothetical protein